MVVVVVVLGKLVEMRSFQPAQGTEAMVFSRTSLALLFTVQAVGVVALLATLAELVALVEAVQAAVEMEQPVQLTLVAVEELVAALGLEKQAALAS
jgi:hypothetical protein